VQKKDYYSILELEPCATQDEVRSAFRRLALVFHPDQSKDPEATPKMQLLNEAYEVLSDQDKRERYDQERIAPPVQEPVQKSSQTQQDTQPVRVAKKDLDPKQKTWIKSRLILILRIILLMSALFLWSLVTGQVSIIAILGIVFLSVYVIASIVLKFKSLVS